MKRIGHRCRIWLALALALMSSPALAACSGATSPPARRALRCPTPAAHSPRQLTILPQGDGLIGMQDVAWSPDGACVALLGFAKSSPTSAATVTQLNVCDTSSGRPLAKLHPDDFVLPALGNQIRGLNANVIYQRVLWSPDGARLAVPFGVVTADYKAIFVGLLITDLSGAHFSVLAQPAPPSASNTPPGGEPLVEWDVSRGALVPLASLPPALGYHWGDSGALVADTPLNTRAAPANAQGPVGIPDGGAAFGVWQPGDAALRAAQAQPGSPVLLPGTYVWTSSFAAWSPDGRYLVEGIATTGRMRPARHPAPNPGAERMLGLDTAPLLPVRDAGLLAVLNVMHTNPPDATGAVSLAWRPDGRYVAERFEDTFTSGLDLAIGIYDCATGTRVASLAPLANAQDAVGQGYFARWSPDGSRLLLVNYDDTTHEAVVIIWGPGALPA